VTEKTLNGTDLFAEITEIPGQIRFTVSRVPSRNGERRIIQHRRLVGALGSLRLMVDRPERHPERRRRERVEAEQVLDLGFRRKTESQIFAVMRRGNSGWIMDSLVRIEYSTQVGSAAPGSPRTMGPDEPGQFEDRLMV
jgi:hypothetical protein